MARLSGAPGRGDVAVRIRARRGGELRPLDEMLLHSPAIADGWNALLGAVRTHITLDAAIRELVVLRVAVLNRAAYEWTAHEPVARREGVTAVQVEALRPEEFHRSPFAAGQLAALDYTDAMTARIEVPDDTFEALRPHFDQAGIVELTTVVAAYNMVSRFLVALDVREPHPPQGAGGTR